MQSQHIKSVAFLDTNHELSEKKIERTIPHSKA